MASVNTLVLPRFLPFQEYAFVETLHQRNVADAVQNMWIDTTSSTIRRHSGACAKIEQGLLKNLLHFAPCEHTLQPVARAAFEEAMGSLSAPENSVV